MHTFPASSAFQSRFRQGRMPASVATTVWTGPDILAGEAPNSGLDWAGAAESACLGWLGA